MMLSGDPFDNIELDTDNHTYYECTIGEYEPYKWNYRCAALIERNKNPSSIFLIKRKTKKTDFPDVLKKWIGENRDGVQKAINVLKLNKFLNISTDNDIIILENFRERMATVNGISTLTIKGSEIFDPILKEINEWIADGSMNADHVDMASILDTYGDPLNIFNINPEERFKEVEKNLTTISDELGYILRKNIHEAAVFYFDHKDNPAILNPQT